MRRRPIDVEAMIAVGHPGKVEYLSEEIKPAKNPAPGVR
jgi:hypothetical protein